MDTVNLIEFIVPLCGLLFLADNSIWMVRRSEDAATPIRPPCHFLCTGNLKGLPHSLRVVVVVIAFDWICLGFFKCNLCMFSGLCSYPISGQMVTFKGNGLILMLLIEAMC